MSRFEIQQIDFQGGIAETIKQNVNQSGKLSSVLWLCNYNPNLEQFTAVMRPGTKPVTEKVSRQTTDEIIIKALLKDLTSQWNENNVIISSTLIELSNPEYQNAYFLFVKWKPTNDGANPSTDFLPSDHEMTVEIGDNGIEATGIWLFTYNPNDNNPDAQKLWYNSFLPVLNIDYPGWYPFGTLKDWQRWGETILFVTKLSTYSNLIDTPILKKYLFPVYKWTYWNLSKKRELGNDRYWNGLTDNEANIDKKAYIVESPLLSIAKSNIMGCYDLYMGHFGTYNGNLNTPQALNTYTDIETNEKILFDELDKLKDIALIFTESNLEDDTNYFIGTNKRYPAQGTYLTPIGDMAFIETFEIPKGIDNVLYYTNYTDDEGNNWDGIKKPIASAGQTAVNQEIMTKDGTKVKILYKDMFLWASEPLYFKCIYPFFLHNYIESQMPRNWLYQDKIPFIVTFVINDQEVIIQKGTKTIRRSNNWIIEPENTATNAYSDTMHGRIREGAEALDKQYIYNPSYEYFIAPLCNKDDHKLVIIKQSSSGTYGDTFVPGTYVTCRFTLRITDKGKKFLINSNVQSIRLYVSKPHDTRSHLRSIGTTFYSEPPPVLYHYPAIENLDDKEIDYTNFGLIKEFKIEGKGNYIEDYLEYRGELHNTNAWGKDIGQYNALWSMPQKDNGGYPNVELLNFSDLGSEKPAYTPDFILWDYPTNRPTLQLGGSGKYWEGLGAGLILVIKGRSFIGQCIDKDGKEEQSIMRYCAMQGPVMLYGIFYDEHKMYIGHNRHIAYLEFREQAIIFSRKDHFRMTLNDISDETTWEINEHYEGHGTFNQKTIISTPYGYVYCNENGIWLSEGAIPKSLTENVEINLNITSLYRMVAIGDSYAYISIYNPGQVPIDSTAKYNTEMELSFDFNNNELVLSSPIDNYTNELRLVFSFSKKNWRAEKYSLQYTDTNGNSTATIRTSTTLHKVKFNNPKLVHTNIITATDISENKEVNFSQQDINLEHDEANWNEKTTNVQSSIQGEIYTHEVGDGKNDFNMHSAIVECVPSVDIFAPSYNKQLLDPEFSYERRNTDNMNDINYPINENEPVNETLNDTFQKWFNMFYHNLRTKGVTDAFQSNLQTPNDNTGETFGNIPIKNPNRESFVLLTPLNSIFRRMRFRFISTLIKKVRSFEIRILPHKRKSI